MSLSIVPDRQISLDDCVIAGMPDRPITAILWRNGSWAIIPRGTWRVRREGGAGEGGTKTTTENCVCIVGGRVICLSVWCFVWVV